MNSQIDFFQKRLESMQGTPFTGESRAAKELLREFPEEDTENVKAYRAAMTLLHYLETNDLDASYSVGDYPLEEKLRRVSAMIRTDAEDDIADRLEVEDTESAFDTDFSETVMHDPVSKMTFRMGGMGKPNDLEGYYAREILEAPL